MTDIMHEWKQNRFIVADPNLGLGEIVVVLTDVKFWSDHVDEAIIWCHDTPGIVMKGMTVTCDSEQSLLLFLLKWA